MKLFYSGAKELDAVQYTPEKSLGGFRSSTVIPNGKVNSIFSNFSNRSIYEKTSETKGFFIKNTFPKAIKNILVYCMVPVNPKTSIELAATVGDNLELLRSSSDIPYYSNFYDVSVIFAYTDIVIKGNLFVGEKVKIENVEILVTSEVKTDFINNAIQAFKNDLRYEIIAIDEITFRLQYKKLGVYTNTPVITSYYDNAFVFSPFNFGKDNSQLISKELLPGDSIGIFLKRIPLNFVFDRSDEYYLDLNQKFIDSNYSIIQNIEIENIKFVLEWD